MAGEQFANKSSLFDVNILILKSSNFPFTTVLGNATLFIGYSSRWMTTGSVAAGILTHTAKGCVITFGQQAGFGTH